jgi:ubiquinone biosynthesis protein
VDSFAQALRAVGEPIFGHTAQQVSMGLVLTQLFEITALFDMRLRPELVLLQKTMMVAEGVARRLYPDHDIWAAADPVVRRYIIRELSPPARLRRLVEEGARAAESLIRRLDAPPATPPAEAPREPASSRLLWFALGAAVAGGAFLLASLLR